jgi:alkylation response protein AidB-like acyl-CoA dehydrogenase
MNNYHFEEHHLLLRDQVRKMVEKHVAPIASEIDENNRFPEELVEIFGDMGLLQLWVPQEYGGPGADLTSVCIVKEEIAKVSESAALLAANNSFGLVLPILNFGTEEQKRHYLGLAAKGRTLTAVAITESGTGSDVSSMKTRAVKDGESWVLNGGKIYITFGSVAHFILVFARTSEGKGANGISAFVVDTSTKGFSFGKEDRKMGIRGVPNVPIFFDNVRIPAENMIGPEGKAFGRRSARSRSAWRRAPSMRRSPMAVNASNSASRSPNSRASSSCWPTCRCRPRRRAACSTTAPAWPTARNGTASRPRRR